MEEQAQPGAAGPPENQDEDFAQLLEQSGETAELSPGAKVTGVIIQIGENDAFVDCGGRSELPIATAELQDESGNLLYQVGDQLTAHVQEVGEEMRLTLSLDLRDGDLTALLKAKLTIFLGICLSVQNDEKIFILLLMPVNFELVRLLDLETKKLVVRGIMPKF